MSDENRKFIETKFERALALYCEHRLEKNITEEAQEFAAKVYYAGALGGLSVLANRLSELPQTTDPSAMIPAISREIEKAVGELRNLNYAVRDLRIDS